jgi:glutathione S-transferase
VCLFLGIGILLPFITNIQGGAVQRGQLREWIALDHPTIADVAAFPAISQAGDGDISLDGYDAIQAWLGRIRKLHGFVGLLD